MLYHANPIADGAVSVRLGDTISDLSHRAVMSAHDAIDRARIPGVIALVPSYCTVTVYYDPMRIRCTALILSLADCLGGSVLNAQGETRSHIVPVRYGDDFGPDLADVAALIGVAWERVIELHCSVEYRVHAVGFMPGFPYLAGLPEPLTISRRDTPRLKVPGGSVAIGGAQTGIYPVDSPGGWHVIGSTPLRLFDPARSDPARFHIGDLVQFKPISSIEYARLNPDADWE